MSIKCKACGSSMDMVVVDEATGTLEICCDGCIKAGYDAVHTDQWNLDSLYWDRQIPCDPDCIQFRDTGIFK